MAPVKIHMSDITKVLYPGRAGHEELLTVFMLLAAKHLSNAEQGVPDSRVQRKFLTDSFYHNMPDSIIVGHELTLMPFAP